MINKILLIPCLLIVVLTSYSQPILLNDFAIDLFEKNQVDSA